jgi:hypothetical protein
MEQSAVRKYASNACPLFMEHRWGQRMPCRARVQISAVTGLNGEGRVRDISSSGAFIETELDLGSYARVNLVVLGNESASQPVEITATVTRVARSGVGVEWCETPGVCVCDVVGCRTRCAALAAEDAGI